MIDLDSISNNNKNINTIKIFRCLLYCWFLIYYNTLSINSNFFWGKYNFIPKVTTEFFFGNSIFNLFSYGLAQDYPFIIVIILDIFIVLSFINLRNRVYPFILYFLTLSLDSRSYYILDGGNNLISILTIYNIFLKTHPDQEGFTNKLTSSFSNLFLLMSKIQVCIVYFVAGHAKLNGNLWSNGTALYYTLSVSELSTSKVRDLLKILNPIFLVIPTYLLLLFQLSFPFLIWFKKTRKFYVIFGMLIHLGISFIMGLTFFGYALCVSYVLFYDDQESKMLINKFNVFKLNFFKFSGLFFRIKVTHKM